MLIPFVLPVVMSFIRRFSGRGMIFPVLLFSFAILREGRQAKKQHNCDHQEIFHTFSLPSRNGSYGCKADWQDWWDRRVKQIVCQLDLDCNRSSALGGVTEVTWRLFRG